MQQYLQNAGHDPRDNPSQTYVDDRWMPGGTLGEEKSNDKDRKKNVVGCNLEEKPGSEK